MSRVGLLHAAVAGFVVLLLSGGWTFAEATAAYLAAGCAGVLGVLLAVRWPRMLLRSAPALVFFDSALISILVFDTGGAGSPFFPLYLLAALGIARVTKSIPPSLVGAAVLVGGYLVAVIVSSGTSRGLFSLEVTFEIGLIALFCAVADFSGNKLRHARENVRQLSSTVVTMRERDEKVASLVSNFTPALRVLDPEGVLDWMARTAQKLLNVPYAHAALLDETRHRTVVGNDLDAYPSWWHPEIQRLVLWSCRTGKVLRKESALQGIEGFVAVPVISVEGRKLGALVIGGKALDDWEERMLELLSAEAASILEENSIDAPRGREAVSGLPNRASLKCVLAKELSQGNALTLLVATLDPLREYRRLYGLTVGDALLGKIGAGLGEGRQKVFHHGDSLTIVLRGSNSSKARKFALHVQRAVAKLTADSAAPLDASVGFVTVRPEETEDPDLILDAAVEAASGARTHTERILGSSFDEIRRRAQEQRSAWDEGTVRVLVEATETKDSYLGDHMRAVSQLALSLGSEVALPTAQMDILGVGALLHDVGKIGVPESILRKPGRLTAEEYDVVKKHTVLGARILASEEGRLSAVLPAVKYHHERFDGKGYPEGLRGKDIPLIARIVSVADAFDNMVRDKPYRRSIPKKAALDEVVRNSGTQFDPEVVTALIAILEQSEGPSRMDYFAN